MKTANFALFVALNMILMVVIYGVLLTRAANGQGLDPHRMKDWSDLELCRSLIVSYEANPVPGKRYDFRETELEIRAAMATRDEKHVLDPRDEQTLRTMRRVRPQDQYDFLRTLCQ